MFCLLLRVCVNAGLCRECSDYPTCGSESSQDSEKACCKTKDYEQRCGVASALSGCIFENFNVPAVYVAIQAVLSLYASAARPVSSWTPRTVCHTLCPSSRAMLFPALFSVLTLRAAIWKCVSTRLHPFGEEDTAEELQDHTAKARDTLVDAVENTEVENTKRAVFCAWTRLRPAAIKEYDTNVRLETLAIDAYNDAQVCLCSAFV